jgi:hypothetical protein
MPKKNRLIHHGASRSRTGRPSTVVLNNWHAAEIGAIQPPSSPVHFILNLHKWPNIWDAKINFNGLSTKVRMTILDAGITGSLVSRKKIPE